MQKALWRIPVPPGEVVPLAPGGIQVVVHDGSKATVTSIMPCSRSSNHKKTSLDQKPKSVFLLASWLLDLLVVVVMNVMVAMMVAMMLLVHRSRTGAAHAENRHRDSKSNCKPEGGEEGLLHGSFPF